MDEMMWLNIQSSNEQNVNSAQYIVVETVLQMNFRGNSRGNLHESQGGLSESSPLRSDGSWDSQMGGWATWAVAKSNSREGHQARAPSDQKVLVMARKGGWNAARWWPKVLKTKLDFKEGHQAWVHSDQMVLVMARQEGWTRWLVAEDAPAAEWQPKRRTQLTLSQGMVKRRDVADGWLDENHIGHRPVWHQVRTEEPFL